MVISKEFRFEASHILPKHPGKCARLHGHSWVLTVAVEGPINPETGFVVDYVELKHLVNQHVIDQLDHQHLGQGFGIVQHIHFTPPFGVTFYPSSENLARAIGKLLQPLVKELGKDVQIHSVKINETCTSACVWRPGDEPHHFATV